MTGEHYRETATAPAYDLVLAVRRRRLHYLGHVLRMPSDRMVLCALMALVTDARHYPSGSLLTDCQGIALPQLEAMASSRSMSGFKMNKCMYVYESFKQIMIRI